MIKIPDNINGVNWIDRIPPRNLKKDKNAYEELQKFLYRYLTFREKDMDFKREYLRKIFKDFQEKEIRSSHLDFINKFAPYVERYYDPKIDYENIEPKLALVRNKKEEEAWKYFRIVGSLVPYRGVIGKDSKYFLWDKTSNTVLGITELSSPILFLIERDKYYGITKELRDKYKNIMEFTPNMSTCVSLYPFSMFTGGKLLTMMMATPEIFNSYNRIWKVYPFGIHTTSIYGKSIQYDRIREWKFLGYTKGYGSIHYSGINIQKITRWLSRYFNLPLPESEIGKSNIQLISRVLGFENLKPPLWYHGIKRGIYGFRLIDDINKLESWILGEYRNIINKKYVYKDISYYHFDNQFNKFLFWKKRWFERRYQKYKKILNNVDYNYYIPDYINVKYKQTYLI